MKAEVVVVTVLELSGRAAAGPLLGWG